MIYKIADFFSNLSRALSCIIYALVTSWKFSIVFLALLPFLVMATVLFVLKMKKHTMLEFGSYGAAGKIAQEILSALRTVLALGLQKKAILTYGDELRNAEAAGIRKG